MRTDIQALRGFAILLVLVYHARLLPQLKAGYLGVDVFFVVSGYLITGIIQRALLAGTFTFSGFYFRRAKRLLPAAYVTFGFTVLLSTLFLTRPEMRDFTWQLLGAVTFTGNIALWQQTGYFEGAANLKPLLHVWSLSIEEQYYLLLPAALVFTPQRFWKVGAFATVLVSLLLCFALLPSKPGAVFYLLPTRAWELGLGSLGILALEGSVAGAWLTRLFWPALAALLLVPFFPTGAPHPGFDALIVCTATLVILLSRHPLLNRSLPARGLAHLGDISYSLYLVHWPLLAFAANAWVSPVPGWVRAGLVVVAFMLAWALYRWVEDPIQKVDIVLSRKPLFMALGVSTGLVVAAFAIPFAAFFGSRLADAPVQVGDVLVGKVCDQDDKFDPTECANSSNPHILVWGDSYATHLVEGTVASTDQGVIWALKSLCGPFSGISVIRLDGFYSQNWSKQCLTFNQSVLRYLSETPSVQVVVLSSYTEQYLSGNHLVKGQFGSSLLGDSVEELEGGEDVAIHALIATVDAIRAMGKRVVFVAPPPASGFDIGKCLRLKARGKMFFGADKPTCEISEGKYRLVKSKLLSFLNRLSREADLSIISFDEFLCHAGTCAVEIGDIFLYRDGGHLLENGSRILGLEMNLALKLVSAAR